MLSYIIHAIIQVNATRISDLMTFLHKILEIIRPRTQVVRLMGGICVRTQIYIYIYYIFFFSTTATLGTGLCPVSTMVNYSQLFLVLGLHLYAVWETGRTDFGGRTHLGFHTVYHDNRYNGTRTCMGVPLSFICARLYFTVWSIFFDCIVHANTYCTEIILYYYIISLSFRL